MSDSKEEKKRGRKRNRAADAAYDEARGDQFKWWAGFITPKTPCEHEEVVTWLQRFTKRWTFQLEKGSVEGKLHYQFTLELKSRMRKHQVVNSWRQADEIDVDVVHDKEAAWNYAEKDDTRVDGPWSSEDGNEPEGSRKVYETPHNWQKLLAEYMAAPQCDAQRRIINLVIDPLGEAGKSSFIKFCRWHKIAGSLGVPKEGEKIIQEALKQYEASKKTIRAWTINIPRDYPEKKLVELWTGLETVKDGSYRDARYDSKSYEVNEPHVVVFTNEDQSPRLTSGRVVKWLIFQGDLVSYTEARCKKLEEAYGIRCAKRAKTVAAAITPHALDDFDPNTV